MSTPSASSTINFKNLDFLSLQEDDFDDIVLSQACQDIENEVKAFDGISDLSLTQCIDKYYEPVASSSRLSESDSEMKAELNGFGTFDLELPETEPPEFTGRNCKTYKGGLKDREITNKQIRHYCLEGDRCIADFFEKYLSALEEGVFYRRPLRGNPIRYGNQVVGVNKLKNMMKVICARGGLKGNYTNHSGKRTCATQLYMAGVDEQEIMQRTGHRSEKGVRKYKSAGAALLERVGSILDPPQSSTPTCKRKVEEETVEKENSTETGYKMRKLEKTPVQNPFHDITNRPFFTNCQISFSLNK